MQNLWRGRARLSGCAGRSHRPGLLFIILCLCLSIPATVWAENLVVGVAANFILPFRTIAQVFEERTSIGVDPIFSSTGNLYAQIKNGAPYDLFLAADQVRPALLFRDGAVEKPFVYARGRLVLWTPDPALCESGKTWKEAVLHASADRIGTANPETAPYGAASVAALKRSGLWEAVRPKLVYGQSIAQAFQFAQSGSVEASFCALSSALSAGRRAGCYFKVEEAPAIIQAACIIKREHRKGAVGEFARFLTSGEARAIKRKYGYE